MTVADALHYGHSELRAGIGDEASWRDAEMIVAHSTKREREVIIAHPEYPMHPSEEARVKTMIDERRAGTPLAYILGHAWFSGRKFFVNEHVLIPRPETELLIETAHIFALDNLPCRIIDVGTGSGAIAVTLAAERPSESLPIFATDISPLALDVAMKNARYHGMQGKIKFMQGNLIEPLLHHFYVPVLPTIIVANLPYLPDRHIAENAALAFEPRIALSGGVNGLDMFRALVVMLDSIPQPWTCILEIDPCIEQSLRDLVAYHFPTVPLEIKKDLQGLARVAILVS